MVAVYYLTNHSTLNAMDLEEISFLKVIMLDHIALKEEKICYRKKIFSESTDQNTYQI